MTPIILNQGMLTSVGLSAPTTAAAVRAGVHGVEETPWLNRFATPHILGWLDDDLLPQLDTGDLEERLARMLRLAVPALQETLPEGSSQIPLFLALPEIKEQDANRFAQALVHQVSPALFVQAMFPEGRAAGLTALSAALDYLQENPKARVLVGGVDSYLDPQLLDRLEEEQRLPSPVNSDGFNPGEAAAFLLLGPDPNPTSNAVCVYGAGSGQEEGHLYSQEPCLGQGLTTAMDSLFGSLNGQPAPVCSVFLSFNGESFWAKEWGVAAVRHGACFADSPQIHHPAEYIGDCGAALSVVCLNLAAMGLARGYLPGPTLITASSDKQPRGAALLGVGHLT